MALDPKKTVAWLAAFVIIGITVTYRHEDKGTRIILPHPVETVLEKKPEPLAEPAHKYTEAPIPFPQERPAPPPVVTVPVTPKPHVVKKPTSRPAPNPAAPAPKAPKAKFKKAKRPNACAKVPPQAYQYPKELVVSAAEQRGITPEQMKTLKACIGAS